MKQLFTILLITISAVSFSQNTGLIVGKILDSELNNSPMAFANVQVKGTDIISTTDFNGLFLIENLKDGDYTLVCNFAGYKTKELEVKVVSDEPSEIKLILNAQTLSVNELANNNSENPEGPSLKNAKAQAIQL